MAAHRRSRRQWPICPVSGKKRLGERKDVHLAVEDARRMRARAEIDGGSATWQVVRGYRCDSCSGGWHLTSKALRGRS